MSLHTLHFSILSTKIFWMTVLVALVKSRNIAPTVFPSHTCLKQKRKWVRLGIISSKKTILAIHSYYLFFKYYKVTLKLFLQQIHTEFPLRQNIILSPRVTFLRFNIKWTKPNFFILKNEQWSCILVKLLLCFSEIMYESTQHSARVEVFNMSLSFLRFQRVNPIIHQCIKC